MPRTKLKKATNKRRISTTEEKYNAFCADLEKGNFLKKKKFVLCLFGPIYGDIYSLK